MADFDTYDFIDTRIQKQRHQDIKIHQYQNYSRRSDMWLFSFFVEIYWHFGEIRWLQLQSVNWISGQQFSSNITVRIWPKPEIWSIRGATWRRSYLHPCPNECKGLSYRRGWFNNIFTLMWYLTKYQRENSVGMRKFCILTVLNTKITVFWSVTSCWLLEMYRYRE